MMFERKALIAAIDQSLIEHRQAYDARKARAELENQEAVRTWLRDHSDAWRNACRDICAKLDNGEPITDQDLPRGRSYGGIATYSRRRSSVDPYRKPEKLMALRELLELSTDEKISTSGLRDLGFGQSAMGEIIYLLRSIASKQKAEAVEAGGR